MNKTVYAGATVIDGTGSRAGAYDVFVAGERIEDVRPHADTHAGWNTVDATGLVIDQVSSTSTRTATTLLCCRMTTR
ncbi:MAG TPA: hypothetical protein VKT72_17210 [Candidatus Baltobacteraceae bacterium]|nr:hypothetical protein [Candidatus Baltobacteraceae bacterium]